MIRTADPAYRTVQVFRIGNDMPAQWVNHPVRSHQDGSTNQNLSATNQSAVGSGAAADLEFHAERLPTNPRFVCRESQLPHDPARNHRPHRPIVNIRLDDERADLSSRELSFARQEFIKRVAETHFHPRGMRPFCSAASQPLSSLTAYRLKAKNPANIASTGFWKSEPRSLGCYERRVFGSALVPA